MMTVSNFFNFFICDLSRVLPSTRLEVDKERELMSVLGRYRSILEVNFVASGMMDFRICREQADWSSKTPSCSERLSLQWLTLQKHGYAGKIKAGRILAPLGDLKEVPNFTVTLI